MPDFSSPLFVALQWAGAALLLFWYTCRVRHPQRPRWQAFLMALTVLATAPPALLAGLHWWVTVHNGNALATLPVLVAFPFILRALIRGWLRSQPSFRRTAPELAGSSSTGPASTASP